MLNNFKNLGILFEKLANKNKNLIILSFSEKEKYSYEYINELSNKFSFFFKKNKINCGDIISIESTKNLYVYAMVIACLKSGITYSFIDYLDVSNRKNLIIKKLNPKKNFIFNKKNKIKNSIYLSNKKLDHIKQIKFKRLKYINKSYNAYIMFTSGSTGFPKGVKINHENLKYFINWTKKTFNIGKKSIMTNINPLHFDNSVFDLYASFFNCAQLVPINKNEIFDSKKLFKKINKLKCNLWFSVPSLFNILINLNNKNIFKKNYFKTLIFGGERFPVNSVRKVFHLFKNCNIFNVSGPTECTCMCSAYKVKKKELFSSNDMSIGKINKYFKYQIKKSFKSQRVGELYLEGPAVSSGYINDKNMTAKSFYKTKQYYGYKSGDLVVESKDKTLKIVGRSDNQVKHLGHRIELEEIEKKINQIFKLDDCLVLMKNIENYPFSKLVLLTTSKNLAYEIFLRKLKKFLPNFMIPTEIKYIENFNYNNNNKIDRNSYKNFNL